MDRVIRILYLLSWLLFLGVVLLFDWDNARLHHVVVGLLAFPGAIIAVAWTMQRRKWAYASMVMSAVTVVGYLVWWGIEVLERYSVDPMPGILRTVLVQLQIPGLLLSKRVSEGDYLLSAYESYWQIAMPLIQLAFVAVLALGMRSFRQDAGARS